MSLRKLSGFVGVAGLVTMFVVSIEAQITLTGTNYAQNFNSISNGLPPGWSVRTNATATSLGMPADFNTNAVSWGTQTGQFGNAAGTINNSLAAAVGTETSTQQSAFTNRCPSIRQTATFGDPGAAFVFQIANTTGYSNFTFSVDLNMLSVQTHSTIWTVDYAVGNKPTSFTLLGTNSDTGVFGTTNQTYNLGVDANDQPQNVWIRITALSSSSGTSGYRDTFGIDNFVLNYAAATVTPVPLFIQTDGKNAVLTWGDASFALQAAPSLSDTFTNVNGAASPFTNKLDAPARFFRIVH